MFLAALSLMLWLLVRGVNGEEWDRPQEAGYP